MNSRSGYGEVVAVGCDRYRKWIRAEALNSLGPSQQATFRAHLAQCAGCRESLEIEKRLLGAINRGIEASVTGEPSPDFLARLESRLAAESELVRPRAAWLRTGWIVAPVAGLVGFATLLAVIQPGWRHRTQPRGLKQTARAAGPNTQAPMAGLTGLATEGRSAPFASHPLGRHRSQVVPSLQLARTQRRERHDDRESQLQVLVEPGQWRNIIAAYRLAQSGSVDASSLAQTSAKDEPADKMEPIEVDPVVVAELYPEKSTGAAGR
jgi:hypothetical protein